MVWGVDLLVRFIMIDATYSLLIICLVILLTIGGIIYYVASRMYHRKIYLPSEVLMDASHIPDVIRVLRKMIMLPHKNIILDFSNVTDISKEGYMIIMAQGEKAFYRGKSIYLRSIPLRRKKVAYVVLGRNDGHKTYHDYVKLSKDDHNPFFQSSHINPAVTLGIEKELKRIGIRDYYEFNSLVTELLGNAIEHGIARLNINWWMYHYKDSTSKTITFVFVDMGIGIIDSYKKAGLPSSYNKKSDVKILLDALDGKLGSSTRQPNRGRGMPQLKHMVEKNWISNFALTTNTVSLRYIDNEFVPMQHSNFVGTYYSWTINKENYLIWKQRSI